VADASLACQGLVYQPVGEIDELSNRAAAAKATLVDCGNSRAVIAAVFKPLERFHQKGRSLVLAQNTYDTTHLTRPRFVAGLFWL
jgi:hypothetical protein